MLKNRYILREKVSSGFCKDGAEFIFDTEDFEKINGYCWRNVSILKQSICTIL